MATDDSSLASEDDICATCLNLEYDSFDDTGTTGGPTRYPLPRIRLIPRQGIAIAAAMFCPICTILDEGLEVFWDEKDDEEDDNDDDAACSGQDEDDRSQSEAEAEAQDVTYRDVGFERLWRK